MKLPPFHFKDSPTAVPLSAILARTDVWTAIALQSVIQILMVTPMQATPLAMTDGLGLSPHSFWLSGCIVAHLLSMFLPGLITGQLLSAFGKMTVLSIGMVMLLACSVLNLVGQQLWNYYSGLTVLGMGWNFAFVSSTVILLASHTPEERTKVSYFNETFRFLCNAVAAIASSWLAWDTICVGSFAIIVLVSFPIGALVWRERSARSGGGNISSGSSSSSICSSGGDNSDNETVFFDDRDMR